MRAADQTPLPGTFPAAALRAARGHCPRCGEARLFRKWLKPCDSCSACQIDWTPQRADDFPAYIAIIVTGHLLAPVIILLSKDFELEPLAIFALVIPLALGMMLGLLQPAKGAVIAAQWWFGLNGFRKERAALESDSA